VEDAFVTDGNAVVDFDAAAPKEKDAVVVGAGAALDPKAGAGWPKTPAAGAPGATVLLPKLKLALETSAGFAPKVGACVVVAGAAAPPNWNSEGATEGAAGVELAGGAPKENVEADVVEGAPKAAEPEEAPKAGAVEVTAPKVGVAVLAAPKG